MFKLFISPLYTWAEIEPFRVVGSLFINAPPPVRTSPLSVKLTSVIKHYKAWLVRLYPQPPMVSSPREYRFGPNLDSKGSEEPAVEVWQIMYFIAVNECWAVKKTSSVNGGLVATNKHFPLAASYCSWILALFVRRLRSSSRGLIAEKN
jgi:hypothetical protein